MFRARNVDFIAELKIHSARQQYPAARTPAHARTEPGCPIWEASGEREVKKELIRLHKQLG